MRQHVYVLQSGKFLKVGRSKNVYERSGQMTTGNPEEINVLCYYTLPVEKCPTIEQLAHSELAQYSHRGEWFDCSKRTAQRAVEYAIRRSLGEYDPNTLQDVAEGLPIDPYERDDEKMKRMRKAIECLDV